MWYHTTTAANISTKMQNTEKSWDMLIVTVVFVRTILAFRFDLFHSNQTEKLCQIESQLDGKCDWHKERRASRKRY